MSYFSEEIKSFKRSWIHHTTTQISTLIVLSATFTVVAFVLSFSTNLQEVLAHWGDSVQVTMYIKDSADQATIDKIKLAAEAMGDFSQVDFINHDKATELFKVQMANYAPDLLQDSEFSHPFPASFQLSLKQALRGEADIARLEGIVGKLQKIDGVEDVSYGQSWVKNYSAFVNTVASTGWIVIVILVLGSLLIVGNAIRSSISGRREEIEILELVGATNSMIRRPFVFEGAVMGLLAAAVSLLLNVGLYYWGGRVFQNSLAFTRLATQFTFFGVPTMSALLVGGALFGALGAYLTVQQINDGWAASRGS